MAGYVLAIIRMVDISNVTTTPRNFDFHFLFSPVGFDEKYYKQFDVNTVVGRKMLLTTMSVTREATKGGASI